MAKGSQKKNKQEEKPVQNQGWISSGAGNRIILVVSIALAIWTTWQITPAVGLGEGILWGIGFGIAVWAVFIGMQRFQRWIRRQ